MSTPQVPSVRPSEETLPADLVQWGTVVWDDAVNLMDYVTEVLMRHFGYSQSVAESLMMEVDRHGKAIVSTGMRERMEADVIAMHSYGIRATLERLE